MLDMKVKTYDSYKDSGVEGIGEIPAHWKQEKLGSCLKPVSIKNRAYLPLLSITREKGVIARDIENQKSNHNFIPDDLSNYKLLEKGQFGMNKMKAWQGSYGVSSFTGIVSPAYYIFDFTFEILPLFFHKAIRSKLYVTFFGRASDGVRIGQWDLSKTRMKEIPFLIPPLPEQQAIATFLDKKTAQLDEAVAIKEKQIVLLKERKQIMIQNAVTQGLNPNAPMRDSGVEWIGEIPSHWEVKRLKYLCKAFGRIGFRGYSTSDLVAEGEGAITISPSNIKGNKMVFKKCTYLSWDKYEESPEIQIYNNDVLIVKTGSTYGKLGLVQNLPIEATINPQLLVLKNIKANNTYFYHLLNSQQVQTQIKKQVIGSTIPTISETRILCFKVGFPNSEEQIAIVTHIETESSKIDKAIDLQQQQIEKLKEYKATLVNSAVTGKIKVV